MELFVVRQFAEFVYPLEIAKNLIVLFDTECQPDIQMLQEHAGDKDPDAAEVVFCRFLMPKIYVLSPNHSRFPAKYTDPYQSWREAYLKDIDASYLAHSRNRMRELDKLLRTMDSAFEQLKPNELRQATVATLEIIKEARAESAGKTQMNLEISSADGRAKVTLSAWLQSLPPEKFEEIREKIERGEQIQLPAHVESGDSLDNASNGSAERSGSAASGDKPSETDPD